MDAAADYASVINPHLPQCILVLYNTIYLPMLQGFAAQTPELLPLREMLQVRAVRESLRRAGKVTAPPNNSYRQERVPVYVLR